MQITATFLLSFLLLAPYAHASEDERIAIQMPDMMRNHMLANMRDHLNAINEIQSSLARGKFDRAANIAEQRLGMTSLEAHQASHMAPFMPEQMQAIGTAMHHAASRFAISTQEASVSRDLPRALSALADITTQCVACHTRYRLR
jgi:hypothetical protein